MDLTALRLNKFQTPYTNEMLKDQPDKVVEWLEDAIANHEFIRRLISKDRPYAKDCERDEMGRAKLDLSNPYIMTNAEYFRPAARFFEENGCYTYLRRNPNPNSEYSRFWQREIRRCWDGMVRQEDGAWITGLEYFYLNYFQMILSKIKEGSKRTRRVPGFPSFFESADFRYHYIDEALEAGKNGIELSKRGSGKSYSIASLLAHNFILGIDSEQRYGTVGGFIASDTTYLNIKKDGTLKKFIDELAFLRKNTPFPRLLSSQSGQEMTWMRGYKDSGGNTEGASNIVFGSSVADDSDKLRGKRGWFMFEEMGNFPNLYDVYNATMRGVTDGDYSIGLIYMIGTANNEEANFESAKTFLYKPTEHSFFAVPNVYDEPNKGREEFGLFTAAYLNRLGCYNDDGVSDVTKALLQIMKARYLAYQSGEPGALLRAIAEDPIDPAEAMIQSRKAYFPVTALNERLTYLNTHPQELNEHYIGWLAMQDNGEVVFKPTSDRPLRHWNKSKESGTKDDINGALEIFQMPQKSARSQKVADDRYGIGVDPVDQSKGQSASLFSAIVFDRLTNRIVAEYTGRRENPEDNYEIVRLLCYFYNAKCLYENNLHGMYEYFKQYNCTYLLCDQPEFLKAIEKIHYNATGALVKGLRTTAPIKAYARDLINKWLMETEEMNVVEEDGVERTVTKSMLYTIDSPALLEELIGYFDKANVDRIMALSMVMIWREQFKEMGVDRFSETDAAVDKDYFGNKDFFKKLYGNKVKKNYTGFNIPKVSLPPFNKV